MASGDPPVHGNPVNSSGMFTIEATESDNPEHTLTVSIADHRNLEMFLITGIGDEQFTFLLDKQRWSMEIRERD